jgi:glycine/D-amino acid oxidase-like deaminating enzyme
MSTSSTTSVLVVGGGVFGCATAVRLAEEGFSVTLLEAKPDILQVASLVNQCRVHVGYHYPRAPETVAHTQACAATFEAFFADSIRRPAWPQPSGNNHNLEIYYLVASERSHTPPSAFLAFLRSAGLPVELALPSPLLGINTAMIALGVKANEAVWDSQRAARTLRGRMEGLGVTVRVDVEGIRATGGGRVEWRAGGVEEEGVFGMAVNAAYAGIAEVNASLGVVGEGVRLIYELVEEPVVEVPWTTPTGFAIMDGGFFGLMPFGMDDTQTLVYHVELSRLEVAEATAYPPHFHDRLAFHSSPEEALARWGRYKDAIRPFLPTIDQCKYIRSIYSPRVLVPGVGTSRPTSVFSNTGAGGLPVVTVLSGKIITCFEAADAVLVRARAIRSAKLFPSPAPGLAEGPRAVIIGPGAIGKVHARWYAAEGVSVAAHVSRHSTSDTPGGPLSLTSFSDALALTRPAFVSVCTPDHAHLDHLAEAAAYPTVRVVLCEKPLYWDAAQSARTIAARAACVEGNWRSAAAGSSKHLYVAYQFVLLVPHILALCPGLASAWTPENPLRFDFEWTTRPGYPVASSRAYLPLLASHGLSILARLCAALAAAPDNIITVAGVTASVAEPDGGGVSSTVDFSAPGGLSVRATFKVGPPRPNVTRTITVNGAAMTYALATSEQGAVTGSLSTTQGKVEFGDLLQETIRRAVQSSTSPHPDPTLCSPAEAVWVTRALLAIDATMN